MRKLARKEKVSIVQLIVAMLCIADVAILMWVFHFPDELRMFLFQCVLVATSIICLLLGLSTWFYNSNRKCHRHHIRIYSVVVMWVLAVLVVGTCIYFYIRYIGSTVHDQFEPEVFDSLDLFLIHISAFLAVIIAILLIIANIYVMMTKLLRKGKKNVRGN